MHPATNKSTCFLFPLTSYFKRESEFEGSNKRSALKRGQEATGSALPGAQKEMTLPCLITIQNCKVNNPFTTFSVSALLHLVDRVFVLLPEFNERENGGEV